MKKRNLIVFLASLSLIFASCNKPSGGETGPVDPPVVENKYTVSFDANGGTGTMASTEITAGQYTLPANGFTAPSGKEFAGWKVNGQGDLLQPGAKINVAANTSLVAQWKDIVLPIQHLDPFVTQVENPSLTRDFNEEFDEMVEDFSGATPSGTLGTGSVFNKSFLRVLVDSENEGEPTTPDAAIYKMATGSYQIQNYEGIGFKMRIVGAGSLQLSNLVLGLRGDDAYKVYEINLGSALNPDGEALSELTHEFTDVIVSPGQSIEDANTVYELAAGGNSDVKVLDKILGFHLYALDEECSAIVEIQEVFLVNAGEKTVLDNFDRVSVGQADATCWWRGSTGFIVQKGVTLNNSNYTTKDITLGDYKNLVLTISGDSSEFKINDKALSTLKDANDKAVTAAVNGAFYSYVINLEKSTLVPNGGKFVLQSGKELVVSQIFLTNLQDELPAEDYPLIDIAKASYATDFKFTVAKGTVKTNYDEAVVDTRVTDAGLNYMISYAGGENIAVDGNALQITGGNYEYCNLVIGSNADANKKYVVFAMKTETKPSGFRFKLGNTAEVVWLNDMLADAGLPSWSDAANYPYVTADGYKLVIVDLARNGLAGGNNELEMYYTGTADLEIGSIFFADAYKPEARVEEEKAAELEIPAGEGYKYAGYCYLPADLKYLHVETNATAANELRFEGANGVKWPKDGDIKDIDGNTVAQDATDYVIDLVASGLKAEGTEAHLHTHSTMGEAAFKVTLSYYRLVEAREEHATEVRDIDIEAGEGYAYVTGYDVPAEIQYIKVETNAAVANELRFEGIDGAKWLKDGAIKDVDGNVVADGSTEYVIDLVASGLKAEGVASALHVHSTKGATAFNVTLSTVTYSPRSYLFTRAVMFEKTIEAGEGYAYVDGYDLPADAKYVLVETTATAANELRFEGPNGAKWPKDGDVKDIEGNAVTPGATRFVIDLVASGLIVSGTASAFHTHSTKSADSFTVKLTLVDLIEVGSYADLLTFYRG